MIAPSLLVLVSIASAAKGDALVERVLARVSPSSMKETVDELASFGTRHSFSDTRSTVRGIGAARLWIARELERIRDREDDRLQVHVQPFRVPPGRRTPQDAPEQQNIYAILPGTMEAAAGRHYVVLGHYDSIPSPFRDAEIDAPGADDNASGTAVVLELARALAGEELDASVVFLATSSEEQGLYGAASFVDELVASGKLDVRAALNNDIVGDPTGPPRRDGTPREARDRIRVFSEGLPVADADVSRLRRFGAESDSTSRQLARFVAYVARKRGTAVAPMMVFRPDRFLRGGDHTEFNRAGVAAVRFCEVYETYTRQHQAVREEDGVIYGDRPEFVDSAYLADVARLNAATLIELACAPSIPRDARLITAGLANDTTLRWSASPEPDVAGYEVVVRATTSPDWEQVHDAGDRTELTLELSKDHWFFGVRAYDEDGFRSPVAFPGASRR